MTDDPPHPASGWTEERNAEATRLYLAGHSCSQIAARLRDSNFMPSRNAVIGRLHRMGVTRERVSAPTIRAPQGRPARAPTVKRESIRIVNARAVAAKARISKGAKIDPFNAKAIPLGWKPDTDPPRIVADVSHAKPWLQRGPFECTWPVSGEGDSTFSCCAPIERGSWCAAHAAIGFNPPKTSAKEFIRGLRRYAA